MNWPSGRSGRWRVRESSNWRIDFQRADGEAADVDLIDCLWRDGKVDEENARKIENQQN